MRVAIYDYSSTDTNCPSCNQAGAKMAFSEIEKCRQKVIELYGEEHRFKPYVDRSNTTVASKYMAGATVRPAIERLLEDVDKGEVDLVVVTYMGALAADFYFILAFYLYLCDHNTKLITVREGERITTLLDQALRELEKDQG